MISPWAVGAVSQMWQGGLMEGVGNNMFAPQEPYTREQGIVTIVKLYLNTGNS
ncbi:MAG: S-layer homology domain-containing protein [Clostridiales bacterium]|jgi:hypothetical protein|nr:S-layer homology domain-containing protein [Clostridiales bacterium]